MAELDIWFLLKGLGTPILIVIVAVVIYECRVELGHALHRLYNWRPMPRETERWDMSNGDDGWEDESAAGTGTMEPKHDLVLADTNAVPGGSVSGTGSRLVPSISRHMSTAEIVALLAVQRGDGVKYKFSANEIAALVGGKRAEVLDQIRAIRHMPPDPEYRPLDDQHRATVAQN